MQFKAGRNWQFMKIQPQKKVLAISSIRETLNNIALAMHGSRAFFQPVVPRA